MPIIDQELFVRCATCGWEAATGIRRTEEVLREDPPSERAITCHRCGTVAPYGPDDFYHRTVEGEVERHDVRP